MVDCKSLSKLKRSSAQMVKRGSELASICRYQGIVSVQKKKFMRDSKLDSGAMHALQRSSQCTWTGEEDLIWRHLRKSQPKTLPVGSILAHKHILTDNLSPSIKIRNCLQSYYNDGCISYFAGAL